MDDFASLDLRLVHITNLKSKPKCWSSSISNDFHKTYHAQHLGESILHELLLQLMDKGYSHGWKVEITLLPGVKHSKFYLLLLNCSEVIFQFLLACNTSVPNVFWEENCIYKAKMPLCCILCQHLLSWQNEKHAEQIPEQKEYGVYLRGHKRCIYQLKS